MYKIPLKQNISKNEPPLFILVLGPAVLRCNRMQCDDKSISTDETTDKRRTEDKKKDS